MDSTLPPLIQALLVPHRYPGNVGRVDLVQTHISWIVLAGAVAYKIKKPLTLPFLDFSTLALRKKYCEEELRLNRRFAPALYLDVVAIFNTLHDPQFEGPGPPIEYAVKMHRFDEAGRLDRVCAMGELAPLIGRAGQARRMLAQTFRIALWLLALVSWPGRAFESPLELAAIYAATVDKRLDVPASEAHYYAGLIVAKLNQAALTGLPSQYLVLVDSSTRVQAVFVYWKAAGSLPQLIGASPASTGRVGRVDYFETPTGVFAHSLANLDFRAEGTKNSKGIRGYGIRGMRVFDFGWQQATRGWGDRGVSTMRLQMHATDPSVLERRLGSAQSKGCIRIPATLNQLIDRYGLLDADYEQAQSEGRTFWVLHPARQSTPWSGRYLIVLDSQRESRPPWATAP